MIKQWSKSMKLPTTNHSVYYFNCILQRSPKRKVHILNYSPSNIVGHGKLQVTRDKKNTHTTTLQYCIILWCGILHLQYSRQQGLHSNSTTKPEPAWSRGFSPHLNLSVNRARRSSHYSIQSHKVPKNLSKKGVSIILAGVFGYNCSVMGGIGQTFDVWWSSAYLIQGVLILIGNALTIAVFRKRRAALKSPSLLLINMSFADLLVGVRETVIICTNLMHSCNYL